MAFYQDFFIFLTLIISCSDAKIPRTDVTVSGISSGGAMAIQLHIAFSKDISGCGILAGPPYYCAGNLMATAMCMSGPLTSISVPGILSKIKSYESSNNVDATSNLQGDPVYIFTGMFDVVALPGMVKLNEQIYSAFGANIKTNYNMGANHGFPTENYGKNCMVLNTNGYINNCNFNMAYDILNHLYGGSLIKPKSSEQVPLVGQMVTFNQKEFMSPPLGLYTTHAPSASVLNWLSQSMSMYTPKQLGWPTSGLVNWTIPNIKALSETPEISERASSYGLDNEGFIYFPSNCAKGKKCSIHVALHGCQQGKYYVKDEFATKAGYLEVAELNDVIIVFPQVSPSLMLPTNPMGCWDWWGYNSLTYATKLAPQMAGVKKIIETVRLVNHAMFASTH